MLLKESEWFCFLVLEVMDYASAQKLILSLSGFSMLSLLAGGDWFLLFLVIALRDLCLYAISAFAIIVWTC